MVCTCIPNVASGLDAFDGLAHHDPVPGTLY
jgi:hypothetical protein